MSGLECLVLEYLSGSSLNVSLTGGTQVMQPSMKQWLDLLSLLPTEARHKLPPLRCLSRTHLDSRNQETACTHSSLSPTRKG